MAKKRVADVLIETLVAAGVKRVYGVVGDSVNGVTDSIRPRKVLVHRQEPSMPPPITFEQATGFGIFMLKSFALLICDRGGTRRHGLWLCKGTSSWGGGAISGGYGKQ